MCAACVPGPDSWPTSVYAAHTMFLNKCTEGGGEAGNAFLWPARTACLFLCY